MLRCGSGRFLVGSDDSWGVFDGTRQCDVCGWVYAALLRNLYVLETHHRKCSSIELWYFPSVRLRQDQVSMIGGTSAVVRNGENRIIKCWASFGSQPPSQSALASC